ncbi:hypothetical protein WA158_007339 [Blastocystis sp. Blastoise]
MKFLLSLSIFSVAIIIGVISNGSYSVKDLSENNHVKEVSNKTYTFPRALDINKTKEYDAKPICNDTAIYAYVVGGLGNQLLLFSIAYMMSIVEKIPFYYPSDSVFENFMEIKSFFPGHINMFNDTRTTHSRLHLNPDERLIDINHFSRRYYFMREIKQDSLCYLYGGRKMIVRGFLEKHDVLFELEKYQKILKTFFIYDNSVYKYRYPPTAFRIQNLLFQQTISLKPIVYERMLSYFPDYNKKRYLSVHLRFGGIKSDYKDYGSRIRDLQPEYLTAYIERVCRVTNQTLVYLASDSTSVKNYVKEHISKNITVITAPIKKVLSTDLNITGRESRSVFDIVAFTEMALLQHGSDCVGTVKSSFSSAACSNINHNAFLITNEYDKNDEDIARYPN